VRHRLVLLLLALVALGAPGLARADDTGGGGANSAVAINTKDDSSLFKFAFAVRHVLGDVVDQANGAASFSSCESCQTTAIAIELVLVEGTPSTVTPTNVAISINQGCTLCDTFAAAYQFVMFTGGPVRFTAEGIQQLHDIRKEIQSWGKQNLSNEQIRALLPGVLARLKDVLAHRLVRVGAPDERGADEASTTETTEGQPNAPPSGTATTETGTVQTTTTVPTTATATAPATTPEPATTTTP
jgi:hypothetical protein